MMFNTSSIGSIAMEYVQQKPSLDQDDPMLKLINMEKNHQAVDMCPTFLRKIIKLPYTISSHPVEKESFPVRKHRAFHRLRK